MIYYCNFKDYTLFHFQLNDFISPFKNMNSYFDYKLI